MRNSANQYQIQGRRRVKRDGTFFKAKTAISRQEKQSELYDRATRKSACPPLLYSTVYISLLLSLFQSTRTLLSLFFRNTTYLEILAKFCLCWAKSCPLCCHIGRGGGRTGPGFCNNAIFKSCDREGGELSLCKLSVKRQQGHKNNEISDNNNNTYCISKCVYILY